MIGRIDGLKSIAFALSLAVLGSLGACGGGAVIAPTAPATAATTALPPSPAPPSATPQMQAATATPTLAASPTTAPVSTPRASPTPTGKPPTVRPTAAPTSQASAPGATQGWQPVSAGLRAQLQSVSCPSASVCLAAGGDTTLLKSVDGGRTWGRRPVDVPSSAISQVYCLSESECLALFNDPVLMTGGILETGDAGETWTVSESWDASRPPIDRISCTGTGSCFGIVGTGIVVRTGADPHWHLVNGAALPPPPPVRYLIDIACPSEQLCLAVGQPRAGDEGIILRITNGGADASRVTNLSQDVQASDFETIACQNERLCLAAGLEGVLLQTQDGGASWTRLSWTPPPSQGLFGLKAMSCPSALVCVVVGGNFVTGQCCGVIIHTVDGGKTWISDKLDLPALLRGVSCTSEVDCVAVGDGGLIVRSVAGVAIVPTATSAPRAGDVIANAVMAAGAKGFAMPAGITDTFPPDWRAIHTVLTTAQAPAGTRFKIVWTAVDIGSAGNPNTKIGEYADTVEGSQNYDYYFTPSGTLPEGTYKVELYVNDRLDRTLNFYVRAGAPTPVVNLTPSPVGNCPPPPTRQSQSVLVQSITLAKNTDASTKAPVNPTSTFSPSDVFHAAVRIVNAPANTRIKVIWFASDVGDAAPCNYQIAVPTEGTYSGTTNLDFTLSRTQAFPPGLYRVEVNVNNQYAMAADFSVR